MKKINFIIYISCVFVDVLVDCFFRVQQHLNRYINKYENMAKMKIKNITIMNIPIKANLSNSFVDISIILRDLI